MFVSNKFMLIITMKLFINNVKMKIENSDLNLTNIQSNRMNFKYCHSFFMIFVFIHLRKKKSFLMLYGRSSHSVNK